MLVYQRVNFISRSKSLSPNRHCHGSASSGCRKNFRKAFWARSNFSSKPWSTWNFWELFVQTGLVGSKYCISIVYVKTIYIYCILYTCGNIYGNFCLNDLEYHLIYIMWTLDINHLDRFSFTVGLD